jgi:hypothetical protein
MDAPEIPTLITERLRLRGIRGSDFEDYAALYADPELAPPHVAARCAG